MMHRHIRKLSQVVRRTPSKLRFNLIGIHRSGLSHQLRQQRRVVTGAGPHMDDPFSSLDIQRRKTKYMQRGLPIVEGSFASKRDNHVLIQDRGIIGWRIDIPRAGKYLPRGSPHKLLARSRRQRGLKFTSRSDTRIGSYQLREEQSVRLYSVRGHSLKLYSLPMRRQAQSPCDSGCQRSRTPAILNPR